jgi:hypothetical protein
MPQFSPAGTTTVNLSFPTWRAKTIMKTTACCQENGVTLKASLSFF